MRRLAVVGNSHVLTIFEGYQLIAPELQPELEVTFIARGAHRVGHAVGTGTGIELREAAGDLVAMVAASGASNVFVMWLGSQVNIRGLLLQGPPFDVLLPDEPDRVPDPADELIPCLAVESVVARSLEADRELCDVISAALDGGARVWLLAPPHALPEQAVRERLDGESHFAERLAEVELSSRDVRVVAEPVRVRLRSLLLAAYRRFAADHGAGFCPPPEHLADADGLLLPQYWGKDITHASAAYGAAYLRELLAVASR